MKLLVSIIAVLFSGAALIVDAADDAAGEALVKKSKCLTCHSVDKKIVGPAYKDVAAKYAGDKTAADKLAQKIMKGGSGVWGQIPMPGNPQVSEAEAKKLAAWVLTLK